MSIFRAVAMATTFVAFSMAPTLAAGPQTETTEPIPDTPNGTAPLPVPATSPPHPGCTPTTSLLRFDGGYEVSMCYRTPDTPDGTEGVEGQAKAGLHASAESGLLWFFSRDNAEVLVKVLNGCAINGHRWVFTAPVTTLEFDLRVTSPTGERWTHTNTQGVTAATKSDVAAFACADEPDAAQEPMAPPTLPTLAAGPQFETTPEMSDGDTPDSDTSVPATSPDDSGCTPTTGLLRFDGGYEVSMCYRTPDTPDGTEGLEGQAKAGLYASAESGLLWFFSRDNAEVLVKVLDGCAINGHRWVFTAPVTTLEFDLRVTSPTGARWNHTNTQGETAATRSDLSAFACADEPDVAPDLIVSSVSLSDENPVAGQTITLRATVRNRGDGPATPTTIRYYRSEDSTISALDDASFFSDAVPALAASDAEFLTFDFTVPSTPDTFYLGACIDSVSAESDTGNNCSDGVRVVVNDDPDEEPDVAPDLIVSSVSLSDRNPVAGQTVTLRATVRNRGDGPATPTTIRYYRSSDSTISASDQQLGSNAVPALSAAATESATLDFRVPSTADAFYLGACIDSVSAESDTGNNCSAGVRVVVNDDPDEEPETAPDLTVFNVSVSDENPVPGDVIDVQVAILNRGDGPSTPTTVRFYTSDDSTINASDLEVTTHAVPALSASATESAVFQITAESPGTAWFGACIDPVSGEYTGNNCSDGVRVDVREPAPDLTVSDVSVKDENPFVGDVIELQVTVQNRGDAPATPTRLRFYSSTDSTIDTEDSFLSSAAVAALAPQATESKTFDGAVFSTPATIYLGACIDFVSDESDKGNNCSDSVRVDVRGRPDLTVSDVSVSDENPVVGDVIDLQVTVQNRGDGPATLTTLRYYRSNDSTIDTEDDEVASHPLAALAASGKVTWTLGYAVPSTAGTYYLGACVDSVSAESATSNNCSVSVRVVVREPAPDLTVSDVSVNDKNPDPGQTIDFRATVQNHGGPAMATTLRYYRSENSTIDTSDTQVGIASVEALAASAKVTWTLGYAVPSTAGTYYLGACVDFVSDESDTSNNCSVSVPVVVRGPPPDLVVPEFTVSDENPAAGAVVRLQATVRNDGDGPASPTTLRYYRSPDSTLDPSFDWELSSQAVAALAASATEYRTLDHAVSSHRGVLFYLGACIDSVSGESDTGNNCSESVLVTTK